MSLDVSVNGKWLAQEVPGFTVLGISGRELLPMSVSTETVGGIDGAYITGKRKESRTLTVTFKIFAPTNTARGDRFNKLAALLNCGETQIIFSDEPDKYYVGIKTDGSASSFSFFCADPFKYSTTLKPFEADENGVITITNNGTMPCSIDYEITHAARNGYIGLASSLGAMEFGRREDGDSEADPSEYLLGFPDLVSASDDTTSTDVIHPDYAHSGSLKTDLWDGDQFVTLNSLGSSGGMSWGGMRTLTAPADSNEVVGAKNFYCYWKVGFMSSRPGQTGEMSIAFIDENDELIAGCVWYKWDKSGNEGRYQTIVKGPTDPNGRIYGRKLNDWAFSTDSGTGNPWKKDNGHCDFRKEGSKVTFFYWGHYYTFDVPEIENKKCCKIQIAIRSFEGRTGDNLMPRLGFLALHYEKVNVAAQRNVPNRYPEGSKVRIDGEAGKIYVNGMYKPNDEILGTTYFKAPPGQSEIQTAVSSWCQTKPAIKALIRERWL